MFFMASMGFSRRPASAFSSRPSLAMPIVGQLQVAHGDLVHVVDVVAHDIDVELGLCLRGLQLFLDRLAPGDVLGDPVQPFGFAGLIPLDAVRDHVDVADGAVGRLHPVVDVEQAVLAQGRIESGCDQGPVFRHDPGEEPVVGRLELAGDVAEDLEDLVGPGHPVGLQVPCPVADVRDHLCPGQDGLALDQRFFCLPALVVLPPDFRVEALEGQEDDQGRRSWPGHRRKVWSGVSAPDQVSPGK